MTKGYTGADRAIAYLFDNATEVSFRQIETGGTPIGEITIDGQSATIYIPSNVGAVKDVLVDGVSVVDQNGDAQLDSSDFGTPVEANPVESPTDDLSTIKIGDTVYDIPSGGGGSSYLASDFYSTDEQVVGSWTDDKPVYQKTIALSSLSAGANNVLITNLEHIVSSKSFIIHNNTDYLEVPFFGENYSSGVISEQACYVYSQAGKVVLFINSELLTDYTKAVLTVQYTKSTDAAGTAPTRNNLIYIPTLYSERERQIGVWTDGKPLYQKTYITDNVTNGYQIDVSGLSIDKLIDKSGTYRRYRANSYLEQFDSIDWRTESSSLNNYGITCRYTKSSNSLVFYVGGYSDSVITTYVTIQYTKTTDQPGSGTWTPEGQLAHHYSTSEKVVGTWIDGSTVYERTIQLTADLVTNDTSWTQVQYDNPVTNMSHLIDCKVLDGTSTYLVERFSSNNQILSAASKYSGTSWNAGTFMTIQYTKSSS